MKRSFRNPGLDTPPSSRKKKPRRENFLEIAGRAATLECCGNALEERLLDMEKTDTRGKTDAALALASRCLRRERHFAEAFHILRLLLERGATQPGLVGEFVGCAHEAGMTAACADLLASLAVERPGDAELPNYAAGLFGAMGDKEQGRRFAAMAAARKPFFPAARKNAGLRLLVLQCAATGDYRYSSRSKRFFMPGISDLYTLLDPRVACHRLLVDDLPAALAAIDSLPPCDLVFNAVSDPDYGKSLDNAAAVCQKAGLPVFNDPRRVRALNRASFPGLANGCAGVMAAQSLRLPPDAATDAAVAAAVRDNGLDYPVIVRAPGFQGGMHMSLVGGREGPGGDLYRGNGLYVIEFVDVAFRDDRAPDTPLYPKYRAFYVNGELYPMHLFVADQYEVHKKTSDPVHARHPWLLEMEASFLEDPRRHLPEGRWDELRAAMASFGVDYFGVDFAVSSRPRDGGRLVLFECNPSMRNWLTLLPEGDRVQRKWRDVTLAAHIALCERAGIAPWPFVLKNGK